jgi:tripartite-type tricarboxylate transporter receptor subunit TctC
MSSGLHPACTQSGAHSNHIVEESLKRATKVDWTYNYVPYPRGDVPAVTALLGGHVTAVLATYSAVIE